MSVKKLIAVGIIYSCICVSWLLLGGINLSRTETSFSKLKQEVVSLHGGSFNIQSPQLYYKTRKMKTETIDGKIRAREYTENSGLDLVQTEIRMDVRLDPRKKGNLWFPTFRTSFFGRYRFSVPAEHRAKTLCLYSPLISTDSIYDNIRWTINQEPQNSVVPLVKGREIEFRNYGKKEMEVMLSYDSSGLEQINYFISPQYNEIEQIRDFIMEINTDFDDFDFVPDTISPNDKIKTQKGYTLRWKFNNTITGKDIGLVMPGRLNPGDIISRVTFFAPVPLLFFFIFILIFSIIKNISIHPMHYFFLGAAFFSFHLIYSYYSDMMNLYLAFAVASAVSLALTSTYLKIFTPKSFAFVYSPAAQMIYLVLFSFSFFFKGITGFIVTTFSVITLFVFMQLTGKISWEEVFRKK